MYQWAQMAARLLHLVFQYYATVDPDYVLNDDTIPWLSRENVEDRSTTSLTGLPEMVSSGQSVGSVVSSTVPAAMSTSAEQVCVCK